MSEQTIVKKTKFDITYDKINSILCVDAEFDKFRISIPRCEFIIENKKIYAIYGDIKILIMHVCQDKIK